MKRELVTSNRRIFTNEEKEAAFEKLAARVAESIAPTIAETIAKEMNEMSGKDKAGEEDDIAANLAQYVPPSDDDFDTLPN
ncbi:hypothetical protein OCT51_11165 [Halomonas sp. LR3S48]|uniref:hypothetical protein n=1 Tax=Halomonas sp. LR3S48 TaxID=2982694 RepID=UPI0021E3BC9F|nr:hypothetical protein [Halomonas sp. LR3S48]UYG01773.1 hypothetical protein OCT51_11165 [Halomonas sp. LR3S48]